MSRMNLKFRKFDMVAIGAVILLAALVFVLFLPKENSGKVQAEIYQDGKLFAVLDLAEDREVIVPGKYTNVVTVKDGKIAVTESDCPGEDCVRCGWMEHAGRSIVCLPNGMEIRIVGVDGDVDFVVG